MTEAATAATFGLAALWAAVAALLVAMVVTDVRTRRIPNELVAGVCAAWVLMQATSYLFVGATGLSLAEAAQLLGLPELLLSLFSLPGVLTGLFTAAVVVALLAGANALYGRVFHKQAMGVGDVKLIGAFALFLGPLPTLVCVMLACLFALVAAVPLRMRTFPFAPALACAFVCAVLVEL